MNENNTGSGVRFGVVFSGMLPLAQTLESAALADRLGYDTCWLGEDYFYQGGIATATAVADRTERIDVGLGILTPLPRHPALTTMELGALDIIANGRVIPGYGAGVRYWMNQMNLDYRSPLAAMREAVEITRELLAGETSNYQGRYFQLNNVKLNFQPHRTSMPIYLGVEGPKALQLSGEIADGTILSVLSSPDYLGFAREQIRIGCERSGRDPEAHRLVVYVIFAVDDDGAAARNAVRGPVAEYLGVGGQPSVLSTLGGVSDDLVRAMGRVYREEQRIAAELADDETVAKVAVAGTPAECIGALQRLIEAGADELVFFPIPSRAATGNDLISRAAAEILPALRTG